jgi:2-pyrone-4,6-dicarboxylate lactonase
MSAGLERPRTPSAPRRPPPPGACDCHAHVFGPFDRFPLAAERSYTPPLAPGEAHFAMLDRVGLAHGVVVHGTAHGPDCGAMLDALDRAGTRLRGVAVATVGVSDAELESMRRRGVRALRFTEVPAPAGKGQYKGAVGFDELVKLAPRMRALGLHAEIWTRCDDFVAAAPRLLRLGLRVVVDHMGTSMPREG